MTTIEQTPINNDIDMAREQIHTRQLENIAAQQEALTHSPEVRHMIRDVGAVRGVDVDTEYTDFAGMQQAMRKVFDFRTKADGSYGERWEAEENAKDFLEKCDENLHSRIYTIAERFGLTGDTVPSQKNVKAGIKLGGGGKSPLDRTQYTKELLDSGELQPEYLVALGSNREVKGDEIERAGSYAEGAKTEFDLMVQAAQEVFDVRIEAEDILSWKDQAVGAGIPNEVKVAYIPAKEKYPPIFIISSAVITDPYMSVLVGGEPKEILRNRANTRDTFATLGRMAAFVPSDRAVAVTNAHFRPFQGAAAAGELAKYGVETETVGFDPKHFDSPAKRSDELLQEMLTTADSLAKAGKSK